MKKIKCDLEVNRVVTSSDDSGTRKETVLRALPNQEGLEGLAISVVVACSEGAHDLPAKGTLVSFEIKWENGG